MVCMLDKWIANMKDSSTGLAPCPLGFFSCFFLPSADFFQNQPFRKIILRIPSECQTV